MLSGAAGQLYGSSQTWQLLEGWESKLDTLGAAQLSHMKELFASRKWYDLIPDQAHTVVTAGYGVYSCAMGRFLAYAGQDPNSFMATAVVPRIRKRLAVASITDNACATAARTVDGSLLMAYVPTARTITIDMSQLAASAAGRWYDPTNGRYFDIPGSPFPNAGARQFDPPGPNGDGDGDWVLLLEAQAGP
jgi:hypothetical protein